MTATVHLLPAAAAVCIASARCLNSRPAVACVQEGLAKWRELNSAEHWLAAAAALNPLTSSLPQLVHHMNEIAGAAAGCQHFLCVTQMCRQCTTRTSLQM